MSAEKDNEASPAMKWANHWMGSETRTLPEAIEIARQMLDASFPGKDPRWTDVKENVAALCCVMSKRIAVETKPGDPEARGFLAKLAQHAGYHGHADLAKSLVEQAASTDSVHRGWLSFGAGRVCKPVQPTS